MAHRRPARLIPVLLARPPGGRLAGGGPAPPGIRLTDVTAASGITFVNATGNPDRKDYIFEVKGGGVGALDYDNDGWVDLLFSRGSSMERWRKGDEPRARPSTATAETGPSRTSRRRPASSAGAGASG